MIRLLDSDGLGREIREEAKKTIMAFAAFK
jgi:isocitrate/isopropylmalate dehydrogenase